MCTGWGGGGGGALIPFFFVHRLFALQSSVLVKMEAHCKVQNFECKISDQK